MGNKLSFETAEKLCAMKYDNDDIFAPHNKYGYKININHPQIRPLYEHYKRRIGAIRLSDRERFDFEAAVMKWLERRRKENEQSNADRQAHG